jgi:hypothetical protein
MIGRSAVETLSHGDEHFVESVKEERLDDDEEAEGRRRDYLAVNKFQNSSHTKRMK